VTGDTWRQSAACDDSESGAERYLAMASNITRHAGLGLHNRRVQVRFLSHLPLGNSEFMGLERRWPRHILRALTPFDPNTSNTEAQIDSAAHGDQLFRIKDIRVVFTQSLAT